MKRIQNVKLKAKTKQEEASHSPPLRTPSTRTQAMESRVGQLPVRSQSMQSLSEIAFGRTSSCAINACAWTCGRTKRTKAPRSAQPSRQQPVADDTWIDRPVRGCVSVPSVLSVGASHDRGRPEPMITAASEASAAEVESDASATRRTRIFACRCSCLFYCLCIRFRIQFKVND